jgi:hypothetical protein
MTVKENLNKDMSLIKRAMDQWKKLKLRNLEINVRDRNKEER